jgi:hypothetical protein
VTQRTRIDDYAPHAGQAPGRRDWVAAILHRWPTWLAALLTAGGTTVEELAGALPLLAFGYLAAAALQRREAT